MVRLAEQIERRVLITGAGRGFGLALAQSFAERGARVFAGARGAHPALERLIERYPGQVVAVELDVADVDSVRRAHLSVRGQVPALDVLINNAAMRSASVAEPIEHIDFSDMQRTLDVNAIGPLRVVQAFLPLLRSGTAPLLVNVSSEAGSIGQCGRTREFDYCMSKAALNMATALLANYLKDQVRVLALHPGWLRTDMGGAHAALDPARAAEAAVELCEREANNASGARFLDHSGKTLPW